MSVYEDKVHFLLNDMYCRALYFRKENLEYSSKMAASVLVAYKSIVLTHSVYGYHDFAIRFFSEMVDTYWQYWNKNQDYQARWMLYKIMYKTYLLLPVNEQYRTCHCQMLNICEYMYDEGYISGRYDVAYVAKQLSTIAQDVDTAIHYCLYVLDLLEDVKDEDLNPYFNEKMEAYKQIIHLYEQIHNIEKKQDYTFQMLRLSRNDIY